MGRRSRKRPEGGGGTRAGASAEKRTRAERDAERARRDAAGAAPAASASATRRSSRPGRRSADERPPAPWGSFPLSEIVIFVGIVIVVWGILSGRDGQERIAAGLVLASLGGGELALREHLSGFKSHSALLAGVAAFAVVTISVLAIGSVKLWAIVAIGVLVFGGSFYGFRELFKRRSGGVGFR